MIGKFVASRRFSWNVFEIFKNHQLIHRKYLWYEILFSLSTTHLKDEMDKSILSKPKTLKILARCSWSPWADIFRHWQYQWNSDNLQRKRKISVLLTKDSNFHLIYWKVWSDFFYNYRFSNEISSLVKKCYHSKRNY